MRTPAQAYGHPRFADDYPWDGGYGEGERRSACRTAANLTAARPGGECSGILPSWITNYPSGMLSGVSFNGKPVPGFGIGQAAGDIFSTLTPAQQGWIQQALSTLHSKIIASTSTTCQGWAEPTANMQAAVACFQLWVNNLKTPISAPLRSDGVLDPATLTAVLAAVAAHPEDFSTSFPQGWIPPLPVPPITPTPAPAVTPSSAQLPVGPTPAPHHGLSTGAKVGIGVGVAGALGGVVYLVTRGGGKRRKKGRRR